MTDASTGDLEARASAGDAGAQFTLALALDRQGRHADALDWLRRAADAGHVPAMTFAGARFLTGINAPLSPREGVPMVVKAAQAGGADALSMTATLAGMGAGMPQSWPMALECLQRAAEGGSHTAQRALAILSSDPSLAEAAHGASPAPDLWRGLRQSVDMAGWLTPPPRRSLCEGPRIRAIDGFIPPALCDWIIDRARPKVAPAMVFDPETGRGRRETARSNSSTEFNIVEMDLALVVLRARIAAVLQMPPMTLEPSQVLHYRVGEEFHRHFDFLDTEVEGYARDVAQRGQRVATFLIYLNDGYEGGETDFPLAGIRWKGRKGDALYFANVGPDGGPDRDTLHAGLPPTEGEKWLFSQWIRDRAPAPVG